MAMHPRFLRKSWTLAALMAAAAIAGLWSVSGVAEAASQAGPSADEAARRVAQLPRYSASGLHQCGSEKGASHSCVVTGLFRDCNEATISLQTRDCCPTTAGGGKSSGFVMSYCIPDYSSR